MQQIISPTSVRIQRSDERAFLDHGWLKTYHSFSFADYVDPKNLNWGALRVFNDDVIEAGQGFGKHPHRDMEILTYVLEGELEHRDSMGNIGVVGPGAVQYLSAGTGITHSEYNHSKERPVHLVQMWVLPHAANLAPRYGQIDYTLAERLGRWLPIATGESTVDARIAIWQDATCYVARLADAALPLELSRGRFGFLFVASGEAEIAGEHLSAGDALRIRGPFTGSIAGSGAELVYWDTPSVGKAPEEA
ncbi:MAG TPA: pirin family protein [Candidatus Dormibacteraeota bacterium]|nr:pirin family protein [Candidatus Dormibacteraeota bacterium]